MFHRKRQHTPSEAPVVFGAMILHPSCVAGICVKPMGADVVMLATHHQPHTGKE